MPGAVTLTVLVPEHTAAVDEQLNTEPGAIAVAGHAPLVVIVPFTNNATLDAAIDWLPVLLIVTVVPAALSMRNVWPCWLSWVWSCVSDAPVAV